jgi:hypothetical protein
MLLDEADAFVEDRLLLHAAEGQRVLVAVAVQADLVARPGHHVGLLGKALDGVAGDEPGLRDPEPLEELEEARHAHLGREDAAADVARAVLAPIAAEPARHRVAMHAEGADDVLGHASSPSA